MSNNTDQLTVEEVDRQSRQAFEQEVAYLKEKNEREENQILNKLNQPTQHKGLLDQSLHSIIIGITDTILGIMDDIFILNFRGILSRDNRLFYIGVLLVISVVVITLYQQLFAAVVEDHNAKVVIDKLQKHIKKTEISGGSISSMKPKKIVINAPKARIKTERSRSSRKIPTSSGKKLPSTRRLSVL